MQGDRKLRSVVLIRTSHSPSLARAGPGVRGERGREWGRKRGCEWVMMKRERVCRMEVESMRWEEREKEVGDCFTNRIPLINHLVWTAGLLKTGRNGIPTWKYGLQTRIRQKNISCQMLQSRGAGEGPCFLVVREPQTRGVLYMAPQGLRLHKATQGPAVGGQTSGQGAAPKASSCPTGPSPM